MTSTEKQHAELLEPSFVMTCEGVAIYRDPTLRQGVVEIIGDDGLFISRAMRAVRVNLGTSK